MEAPNLLLAPGVI